MTSSAGFTVRTPPATPPTPTRALPLELLRERSPSAAALNKAGFATIEQLYDAVAAQFRLPRLALDTVEMAFDLSNLVSAEIAAKHKIVPVFATAEELTIATSDPTQLPLLD